MKKVKLLPVMMATTMLMVCTCVSVQGQSDSMTRNQGVAGDAGFVSKNIRDNQMEVEMSKMALDKSTNPKIKSIAQQMVTDHTKMLEDLRQVQGDAGDNSSMNNSGAASQPGDTGTASNQLDMAGNKTSRSDTSAATGMSDENNAGHDALMNASGKEFEDMWVTQMLDAHKAKLDELTAARSTITDQKLKAIVEKAIPKVRMHKEKLEQLSKGSGKMKSKNS